jgi:hypothetical protein
MVSKHHLRYLALPFLAAIAVALPAPGCQESASATRTQKVAVIKYRHDTCTFCPGGDTTPDCEFATIDRLFPFGTPS